MSAQAGSTIVVAPALLAILKDFPAQPGKWVVITHYGTLPINGGKRWGYVSGNNFYPYGSSIPIPLSFFWKLGRPKPKPKAPEKPRISYSEFFRLPYAADYDGECCDCRCYPNRPIAVEVIGSGEKMLIKCHKCGKFMLPRGF